MDLGRKFIGGLNVRYLFLKSGKKILNIVGNIIPLSFLPSKEDTWTCGVWLAANEWQLEPTEAYFVFPKQNRIECPVSAYKERSEVAENCKRLGQNRIADREYKVLNFKVNRRLCILNLVV